VSDVYVSYEGLALTDSTLAAPLHSTPRVASRGLLASTTRLQLGVLFFCSGATGLVYQLLWVRMLYQAFGSTIQSVTTVVAAYMGGLGLGAWLLGRYADRHPRPAALYGWLELAIGAFGVASPLVLGLAHRVWVALASGMPAGSGASIATRFGLAALVLFIPTTLMGGTLPVLTRAFTGGDREALKPELGKLYGLNTLGAVAGTALAGLWLIEHVGIRHSLWLTAMLNVMLGAAAVWLARRFPPVMTDSREVPPVAGAGVPEAVRRAALFLLGATAFAGLLDEIAWTRVIILAIGSSTYAFTIILAVFLLGIGIGSALVARRSGTAPLGAAATAALAQGITAIGAVLLIAFLNRLPAYVISVFHIQGLGASGRLLHMALAVVAFVLPPAIGMGMTFPLLTDLVAAREGGGRAADVGRAYALNTAGSILGAVLTGFVLLTLLGSDRTLRLGIVINAVAALGLALLTARGVREGSQDHRRFRVPLMTGTVLATIALAGALLLPRWSTEVMDVAPAIYGRDLRTVEDANRFLNHMGSRQLAFREGLNATVSVWESQEGRALGINGKIDASDYGDMDTQLLLGLTPAAARPGATSAFVIGFGSGTTAGTLARLPGMRRVRVAEIEPAVLAMGNLFRHVNGNALAQRTVSAVVDDARSALQLEPERFDIIASEPSNPWVAGVATLYTPEFLRQAKARLNPGGVFSQWVQLYQLPIPVVASIVANVRSVFPHVEVWMASPHDILLLGSDQPLSFDRQWLSSLFAPGAPFETQAREWLGIKEPEDFLGRSLLGPRGVEALIRRAQPRHTDDQPALEYEAARRFFGDVNTDNTVDSLLLLRDPRETHGSLANLARAHGGEPDEWHDMPFVTELNRREPGNPEWLARLGQEKLAQRDTAAAESLFVRAGRYPSALQARALIATNRAKSSRARQLMDSALAAGGDTTLLESARAWLAVKEEHWPEATRAVTTALKHSRHTFAHPFPINTLIPVLQSLAVSGPPDTARMVLVHAGMRRPGWALLYELDALAAFRLGDCAALKGRLGALAEFGIHRPDGADLYARCRDLLQH
jgi:spermidine synthase